MHSPRTVEVPATPLLTTGSVPSEVSLLFRTKRVSDIRAIESRIRTDIDDKADSLRHLLGTRYRDLLLAADRLSEMRTAASTDVRSALHSVSSSASSLRDRFASTPGDATRGPDDDELSRRRATHAIAARLKRVVDAPEALYAALEAGELYDASSRFVRARTDRDAVRAAPDVEDVAGRFAESRWALVAPFDARILAAAERRLVDPGLSAARVAHLLAAVILLTPDCDVAAVVDGMLAARAAWIDDDGITKSDSPVADRLRAVAVIVRDTILALSQMFVATSDAPTDVIEDANIESLVRAVDTKAADRVKSAREDGAVRAAAHRWIDGVRAWLCDTGVKVVSRARTSRELADSLRAIEEVLSGDKWEDGVRNALDNGPDFVFELFAPLISKRAAIVARECVAGAVARVVADVDSTWADVGSGTHAGRRMWAQLSARAVTMPEELDVDVSLRQLIRDGNSKENGMDDEERDVAHMLSCDGRVDEVLRAFDSALRDAMKDVGVVTARIPAVRDAFGEAVRDCLPAMLEGLRKHVIDMPESDISEGVAHERSVEHHMQLALFAARVATAMGTTECVDAAFRLGDMAATAKPSLSEFRTTALDVATLGYRTWAERLCVRLGAQLAEELDDGKALCVEMGWSRGDTDESRLNKNEENGSHGPRFPTTASTPLVRLLVGATAAAGRAGGFALPREAVDVLRDAVCATVATEYGRVLSAMGKPVLAEKDGRGSMDDRGILQLLFDVQAVRLLAGGRDENERRAEALRALEMRASRAADPIELAAIRQSGGDTAVADYAGRAGVLFGGLAGRTRRGVSAVGVSAAASNVIPLAGGVARFTYLPAPMPSTYAAGTAAGAAGLNTKAALGVLRSEAGGSGNAPLRKREMESSVVGYASKVSESVGRLGRGFFESLTRKVG